MVNNYHLTAQQISIGIHLSLSNADSFLVEAEEFMTNRRKDYAVNHVKNLLNLLLFTLSMLRGSLNRYNNAIKIPDDDEKNCGYSLQIYLGSDQMKQG